jgi:tetratricopeptide (TPR) repeat protein
MKNRTALLLALFLCSLLLKLLIFFWVTEPILFSKYPVFAERLSKGLDLGERLLDLSPLYLYINLLFHKVYGKSWEGLALLQIFLGSLNILLVYLIGEKVFSRTAGFLGALLLLLYGNMTLFELTLEPETLVIFLNSLVVLSLLEARERILSGSPPWRFFIPGILLGLSVITKPNVLLFLPPAILWIGWMQINGSLRMKASLFLLLGFLLVISTVTLRNYLKVQDFVLITADGGKVFYHGNGPGGTGMERADLTDQGFREEGMGDPDPAHALFRKAARSISGKPLKPSECSNFWFRRTLNFMSSSPLAALSLVGKKFFYFWGNYEVHEIDSNYKYDLILRRWPLVPFGVLSILGMVGMTLARKRFRQAFLLYSMVGVYLLSVLIFFAASRYRVPAAPFLALFGAFALNTFFTLWKEKRRILLFGILAFSVLLWPLINLPFRNEVQALERWQMATRIHYSLGGNFHFQKRQYREAVEEYRKALVLAPDFAPAYNRLGMCHAILNEMEEAEKNFRKVVELAPDMDQGYLNLGMVHLLKGEPEKAVPLLEKALSLNPENARAREQLQNLRPRSSK